ncbi:hypothetical protein GCM10007388_10250 [Pseudoduganella plicata]|uniref:GST C-terminal domain-containing protein n=1 Tax=Pseudoduganella plicata TaxID=321984 RepID=A0AA88C709_9BURK|nr:hypothetical protein GCM10007388_10250 [Pseudoduganella plicata]
MFQTGGVGPMVGQLGFFHRIAGKEYEDKRPLNRYVNETKRLPGVPESRLAGREWIMGDECTVADIATMPRVRNLVGFYEAADLAGFDACPNVAHVLASFVERPAVIKGLATPS